MIVDPATADELPEGGVGEIWLQGNNICRGYWGRPDESRHTFGAKLRTRPGHWLRTGDLGVYVNGELYVVGRIADSITIEGARHYPQDIEATAAEASPMVRRGYVAAFTDDNQRLVIVAERAAGTARDDPTPAMRPSDSRCRTSTGCRFSMFASCLPEPSHARRAASWHGGPVAPVT
jgi:fatty-acyl-CoA synthase